MVLSSAVDNGHLPVVLHELPACLDKLAERPLRRAETHEFRGDIPSRFIGAHEFRHLAEPLDYFGGYRLVDALLTRQVLA